MIVLTQRQKAVYDALRVKTAGGARSWVGRLKIEGSSRSKISHTISQLVTLGVASTEKAGRVNRYRLLLDREDVESGSRSDAMRARYSGKASPVEVRLRDDGGFLRRAAEVSLPQFENGRRTISLGRHAPPRHDARAL